MRSPALRIAGALFALVVVAFAARSVVSQWSRLQAQPVDWQLRVPLLVASLVLTWAMYALLIQAWRVMLAGWGQRIGAAEGARIWTVSSLGKYVPGQVWAIASMAVMAQRAGVAPWAATGSSILLQGLAVGTGVLVFSVTGLALLGRTYPWMPAATLALGVASALGVALLLWPPFVRRVLALFRVEAAEHGAPRLAHVAFGLAANVIAWLGYGVAFWLVVRGLLPDAPLTIAAATGAFVASYLAGFLAFGVPDGIGVREGVAVVMLHHALGPAGALGVVAASRLILTVAQIGAAAPFLFSRGARTRVAT